LPELITRGHVYIAQPPLYRAKRGKSETYIKDDRDLEAFLVRRAVDNRAVRAGAENVSGPDLERLLQRAIAFRKQTAAAERRGFTAAVIEALLHRDVHDKAFFADEEQVAEFLAAITTHQRTGTLLRDEEHNRFQIHVEDRSGPYVRRMVVGAEFIGTADYRALLGTWRDIQHLKWPVTVITQASIPDDDEVAPDTDARETAADDSAARDAAGLNAAARDTTTRDTQALNATAEPTEAARGRSNRPPVADVPIANIDELVDYFLGIGKKGVAINRYKGLGEMNPDQLWATTMDPDARTVLLVRAEDHTEADQMFTTLMGDQVEPRRKFIEDNALDVRNLDI
jgi:DNA gyrase subunit B